jgi:hypothetical protein
MKNCTTCLFQGDKSADEKNGGKVFCMVKVGWLKEDSFCSCFKEYAELSEGIRLHFASEIRQEEAENRRLKKISRSNLFLVIVTFAVSFLFFVLTVKFFDKYIF